MGRNLEHVMHAQKKVVQNSENQISHLVVSQLVANQTSQLVENQTSQLETNQLEISQLVKNHQQENARTLPLCSVKILFSLPIALPMTLAKCLVMSNAQMVNSSWAKTERPVLKSLVNARVQNASGQTKRRRLLTVK